MATPAAVLDVLVRAKGAELAAKEIRSVDTAGKRAHGTLSKLGKTAAAAGGLLGGLGLAKGLNMAVSEYREAQKAGAQTNAVLKSTGRAANVTRKHVEDLAGAISKKVGIDDEAIQSGENLLLTFTKIRNETGKGNKIFDQATRVITDMSVALGQDMKSSAIQVGKALQDPVKGITALRRVGVNFNQQQSDQIKKMVQSGHQLEAQRTILKELRNEFGGSAAAQATAGDKLKVSLSNLAEAAGGVLVPQLDKVAVVLTRVINQFVEGQGIAKYIVPAFNQVKQAVVDLISVLQPVLEYIGPRLVAGFNSLPAPIKAVAVAFAGLAVVAGISSPLMAGLVALAAAIVVVKRNWSSIAPVINHVRDSITAWVDKNRADIAIVMKAFSDVGAVVRAVFHVAFPVAVATAKRALDGLKTATSGALQLVQGAINVFLGILHGDWSRVWGGLKDIAAGGLRAALGTLKMMTAPFREVGSRIVDAVIDGLSMLGHAILNKFKDAANFVIKNVGGFFKGVGGAITKGVGKINPFGDGLGKAPGKPTGSLMGARSSLAPFAAVGAANGLRVSSGLRPGAITSSGNVSYHSSGEAIDMAGSPGGMLATFRALRSRFGSRLAELIYTPGGVGIKDGHPFRYTGAVAAQHMDHVHVAFDTGKPGVGDGLGRRMLSKFKGDGYGIPSLEQLWMRAGGPSGAAAMAAAIAMAESGGKAKASNRNSNGTIDRGLWQINSSHGRLSTFDPLANARAAVSISSGGRNWGPWTTYRTGAYKKYLASAQKATKKTGATLKASSGRVKHSVKGKFPGGFTDQQIAEINAEQEHRQQVLAAGAQSSTDVTGGGEDPLADAMNALAEAERQHTEALTALQTEIKRQTDFATSVANTSNFQLTKTLADLISGQIVGYGVAGRSFTPGVGVEHAY